VVEDTKGSELAHTVALIIIHPDRYVGITAPASEFEDIDSYFAAFMIPREGTQLPHRLRLSTS